ncbi:MAG: hypothetical protein HKO56_08875, partial [Bacteroidia bacterium]|nr:hypothetical protein [Bacteroidia bacterium]
IGVSQLTVFDNYGIARAERLVFLNQDNQLNISLTTNKQKYTPREKVELTVKVTDDRGIPIPASLSLSVVNDQLLSFADDKSGTIVSQLLLEQDLDQEVHEPGFYFDKKEAKASKSLDYLMMTSGWRRFTWKEVIDEDVPVISFNGEKAIIGGTVYDHRKSPVSNATIKIIRDKVSVKTDANGKFTLKNIDLSSVKTLAISGNNIPGINYAINEYREDYEFYGYHHLNKKNAFFNNRIAIPEAPRMVEIVEEEADFAHDLNDVVAMAVEDAAVDELPLAIEDKKIPVQVNAEEKDEVLNVRGGRENAKEYYIDGIKVRDNRNIAKRKALFQDKEIAENEVGLARPEKKVLYTQSREFSAPVYKEKSSEVKREDFRSTIFWDGIIELGRNGKTIIEFYTSDEITSFKAIVEGTSSTGEVGRAETLIYNQLPVTLDIKLPNQLITADKCNLPLTLTNNTEESINGEIKISHPKGMKYIGSSLRTLNLSAGQSKTIHLKYNVIQSNDSAVFSVHYKGPGFEDEISKVMQIIPQGFPSEVSYSAQDMNAVYNVALNDVVKGSVSAQLTAYPSVVGDLLSGVESILRRPSGCFEQTSMSSYPNILVMDYLKTTENEDKKLMARASNLLDAGYNKLVTFETSKKGYDWFGRAPANEALTAYGLMQFNDMKSVYQPDQGMIDRTAAWLMSRRDGKGGFKKHQSSADSYGRANEDITNAYIVYALCEAGYKKLDKEIAHSYQKALKSNDAYMLAMLANTMHTNGDNAKAQKLMTELIALQKEDGSFTGSDHSITRSTGKSLNIETSSIALMAMLKSDAKYRAEINKSVEWLITQRSGHGNFGNTQGTILALKALTQYAKQSKKIASSGEIEILVDGFVVETKTYEAGSRDAIEINGLEKYLKTGNNRVRVKFKDTDASLPYTLMVNWNTTLPGSAKNCAVKLDTDFVKHKVASGENIRLNAKISNTTDKGLASPIAIIGIPAGLSLQSWQLDEMQEEGQFDFYEIADNNIIIYLRQLAPSEKKEYSFDLKADIPGSYKAAASCAYLYYSDEYKHWTDSKSVTVEASNK